MMFPKEGKYVCSNTSCGEEKEIGEKKESFKTESKAKETTIISGETAMLPKAREICPECGNTEAYYYMRQNRSADEPETIFYRCTKCNHQWHN